MARGALRVWLGGVARGACAARRGALVGAAREAQPVRGGFAAGAARGVVLALSAGRGILARWGLSDR